MRGCAIRYIAAEAAAVEEEIHQEGNTISTITRKGSGNQLGSGSQLGSFGKEAAVIFLFSLQRSEMGAALWHIREHVRGRKDEMRHP